MSKQPIVVRGTTVNNTLIAAYAKRANSMGDVFTVWANAAVLQVAQHGNKNWLDSLFNLPMLRLANGDLSKTGRDVLAYTIAHFPRVMWDAKEQKVLLKKYNAESPLAAHFVAVGIDADKLEEGHGFTVIKGKAYTAQGDFLLTLADFLNLPKPDKEVDDKTPSVTAKSLVSNATKALKAMEEKRFAGTAEEVSKAAEQLKALYLQLAAMVTETETAKAEDGQLQVDVEKAGQLLQSGQKGASARAGQKVAA